LRNVEPVQKTSKNKLVCLVIDGYWWLLLWARNVSAFVAALLSDSQLISTLVSASGMRR
jgi:hypothetical protein